MSKRRFELCVLLTLVVSIALPTTSQAIPAFARKTGFNCMMCHTAFPKLNDWGQRYRDNGYQLPGQVGKEQSVFDTPPPIAIRTSTGFNAYNDGNDTTGEFDVMGLDLLAAGVLHTNVSALIIYTPRIDEPSADPEGTEPSQPGAVESASVVFSNIIPGALNARVGRFEPAYHLISSKRSYYLISAYDIYDFQSPAGTYLFNDNQIGVELTGHFRSGLKYAAGVVNGSGPRPDPSIGKDVYACIGQTFGPGDGQSAGQRISAFGYYGKQAPTAPDEARLVGAEESSGEDDDAFYRYGGAVSLNWQTLNLQALYMMGTDDKCLNSFDPSKDYEFSGGFVELDYAGLMNNRLVASIMHNWIEPPDEDPDSKLAAYSCLLRYYLGDWKAVNVALHAEYMHRVLGTDDTSEDDTVSLLVDFAF